jgi:hypothetical protein
MASPIFVPPDGSVPRAVPADWRTAGPFSSENTHSYLSVGKRLASAIAAVETRVHVDPRSRVSLWRNEIRNLDEADKRDVLQALVETIQQGGDTVLDHPFRSAFTALTESRTFIEVVENLLQYLTDGDLAALVSGHADPAADKASARARDMDFQWYVASAFLKGGIPISLAEPDVLLKLDAGIRSVAVKRIGSRKKLKRRIKEASEQIEASGYSGYIMLDVTKYLNPDQRFVAHWRNEAEVIEPRLQALASSPTVTQRHSPFVQGVFLRAAFPLISPGFQYGTLERWLGVAVKGGNKKEHIGLLHRLRSALRYI